MTKFVIALTVSVLLSLTAFAQPDQDSIEWKTISDSAEEFDFQMPSVSFVNTTHPDKRFDFRTYSSLNGDTVYKVFTNGENSFEDLELVLNFASGFKTTCETIQISDFQGHACSYEESGYTHEFTTLLSGKRHYLFYAYTKGTADPAVNTFFSSIKYVRSVTSEKSAVRAAYESIWKQFGINNTSAPAQPDQNLNNTNKKPKTLDNKSPKTSDEKTGSGIGPGETSGSKAPDRKDTPLNLLSKPRPKYTAIARRFNVVGSVKLRVVFGANGLIGSTSEYESLPFGLTNSAKEAARGITFVPEHRDRTPINVIKMVVFRFTIY